jgi:hypothetical protein
MMRKVRRGTRMAIQSARARMENLVAVGRGGEEVVDGA